MNEKDLKRLMQVAKKIQGPVIITDPAGDEPLVLVDLNTYEHLLDQSSVPETSYKKSDTVSEVTDEIFEQIAQEMEGSDELPVIENANSIPEVISSLSDAPTIPIKKENDRLNDEEQFYLEPID